MSNNWTIKSVNNDVVCSISESLGISENIAYLLASRDIETPDQAVKYLFPKISFLDSPFLMHGMHEAVDRLKLAIQKNQKIAIFSDSDLDGLTSLVVLMTFLKKTNLDIIYKYPVGSDSYGLTKEIIDDFSNKEVNLLVTLDCGVKDVNEINYAREQGIDVIVCDHHEQGDKLPDAIIINPKQKNCNFPFSELAGVGVAFYFVLAVYYSYLPIYDNECILLTKEEDEYFVSIIKNGIISENFPTSISSLNNLKLYIKENTFLIYYKLQNEDIEQTKQFNIKSLSLENYIDKISNLQTKSLFKDETLKEYFRLSPYKIKKRINLFEKVFCELSFYLPSKINQYILEVIPFVAIGTIADIMPVVDHNRILIHYGLKAFTNTNVASLVKLKEHVRDEITAKAISWKISPLLNSPGRFGKTDLTAGFLMAQKNTNNDLYEKIVKLNEDRKILLNELFEVIINDIDSGKYGNTKNFINIKSNEIPDGLTGLIANKVTDLYNLPVIVMTETNVKNIWKGSGRVIGSFDFYTNVQHFSEYFEKFGGHAQAFGFSICEDQIEKFTNELDAYLEDKSLDEQKFIVDMELNFSSINNKFLQEISMLEPFGNRNEEPVFLIKEIPISGFKYFGATNNHGKYSFENPQISAIGWNIGKEMKEIFEKKMPDILCKIEKDSYRSNNICLIIQDMK